MVDWNECGAHARHVDDQGRETVVHCDLPKHAPDDDATAKHFDERLDVYWQYADGLERYDDEPE